MFVLSDSVWPRNEDTRFKKREIVTSHIIRKNEIGLSYKPLVSLTEQTYFELKNLKINSWQIIISKTNNSYLDLGSDYYSLPYILCFKIWSSYYKFICIFVVILALFSWLRVVQSDPFYAFGLYGWNCYNWANYVPVYFFKKIEGQKIEVHILRNITK